MAKKSIKHLSREFDFPKNAYVCFLWILTRDRVKIPIPYQYIFTDVEKFREIALNLSAELSQASVVILDQSVIVPLKLEELYPLKRKYWKRPTVEYGQWEQMQTFLKALRYWDAYKLVVTPIGVIDNTEYFSPAIPLLVSNIENDIEYFMQNSKHPVDETAKYAAIYSMGKPIGYDLLENSVFDTDSEAKDLVTNVKN
jgi:hypothetical protein